ncbi:PAS domain S-box protein [Rubrivivax rivuli]|uniref:histidine kinase n=1 Tax=Rubrivivax rivuli TaxID=1862385 RepID=A0A437RH79_9BURK|nr:PAS domain S-box protein [Rubrivivax rivuli]RVU46065.1 PAS domain-containing sensor histidine kinase [Rubrivivax rivuli]
MSVPLPAAKRLFGRWWRSQSPARQDRFATLGPLLSVLLFLAAIISAFWYLRNEEIEREIESVKRDTELTQQQVGLRLIQNQEALIRMARDMVERDADPEEFVAQAVAFARERPELTHLSWVDARRRVRASHWAMLYHPTPSGAQAEPLLPVESRVNEPETTFRAARDSRSPVYSRSFVDTTGAPVFQLQVPLVQRNAFNGVLIVEYSIDALVRHFVPADVAQRHLMSVLDEQEKVLAATVTTTPGQSSRRALIVSDAPLTPALNGLLLRGQGWRTSIGLVNNTLFWMVVALSVLTVWMLLGTWRHVRRRSQIQGALVQETNFRRAMENSMPTGMRAMDMEGRVTYVNAAFCQMTGFSNAELVGRLPPYPYWPPDRIDENHRLLQQELQGRSPSGGIEVRLMRKDGSVFDARMYISPLIDPKGQQTGWMTSITNITEAKRIRDQLSASHERFTTVLEGLDASVSVLSVQQGELLFVNRSYRLWFGGDAVGHQQLAGGAAGTTPFVADAEDDNDPLSGLPTQELTETGANPREVFVESLQKWFDVRARYLQWTDGRLAQMLIATDITARLRAEEQAAAQAEKAQVTSRLVTMGEMASSVAHELNQPLTAITNYCNGMVSRVKAESIAQDDLIAALQKTARQAERAGQIIHRIRNFVKRSEPQRQPAEARQIVEDAVELAGIELRRRNVAIHTYVAQRLPIIMADPILIEQVLLNLLKNAAEAIDSAQLPTQRRHIELRVVPRHTPEEGGVIEFSVTDMGPGIKDEVIGRLYEAFFSTKAEGLGIGLSLCRSIIESHRGRMRAQNLYNGQQAVGCRFAFTLPVETTVRIDATATPAEGETTPSA